MNELEFEVRDGVAVLTLANPPVNSLGSALRTALVEGLERANADEGIGAIVVINTALSQWQKTKRER